MNFEDKILKTLAINNNINQRQLAESANVSVGYLNDVLHKLVDKELVVMKRVDGRTLQYLLTPSGIKRNLKRTYNYLNSSLKQVVFLKEKLNEIYAEYTDLGYKVYIDGFDDYVFPLIREFIHDDYHIEWLQDLEDAFDKKCIVIAWEPNKMEQYEIYNIEYINLLEYIDEE